VASRTEEWNQASPRGLSEAEALARLERYGPNALPEKPPKTLWLRFATQFRSPLIYILLFALVVDLAIWFAEGARGSRFVDRLDACLGRLPDLLDVLRRELAEGHQAYVVLPLVEESEKLSVRFMLKEPQPYFLELEDPAKLALYTRIKEAFERIKSEYQPSLVLTHYRDDLHQDHRVVSELTYNTFRDHLVWEYEIPKYDGDLGNPNLFAPLPEETARCKVAALLEHFPSQRGHRWFTADTFFAMLHLRGVGCNAPAGVAEAFYCRKAVV